MNYLELLQLASPETIVVVTALVVLALGLTKSPIVSLVAALGLAVATSPFSSCRRGRIYFTACS